MSTSLTTRLLDAMTQLDAAAEVSSDLLALPSVRDPHRLPLNHPRRLRVELTLALGKALATADERKLGELRSVTGSPVCRPGAAVLQECYSSTVHDAARPSVRSGGPR